MNYFTAISITVLLVLQSGCLSINTAGTATQFDERLPKVSEASGNGNYVALSYSKAANTVYCGRSSDSRDDALNKAITACPYSDCNTVKSTNHNGCVAFSAHYAGGWGYAARENADDAKFIAQKLCNAYRKDDACVPVVVVCPQW